MFSTGATIVALTAYLHTCICILNTYNVFCFSGELAKNLRQETPTRQHSGNPQNHTKYF